MIGGFVRYAFILIMTLAALGNKKLRKNIGWVQRYTNLIKKNP